MEGGGGGRVAGGEVPFSYLHELLRKSLEPLNVRLCYLCLRIENDESITTYERCFNVYSGSTVRSLSWQVLSV